MVCFLPTVLIAQSITNPTFEGWVQKKSRHVKKWRNRWLVLHEHFMYTFKEEQNYVNPTEIINLEEFGNLITLGQHEKGHMFALTRISGKGNANFEFAVRRDDEYDAWKEHIEKIIG